MLAPARRERRFLAAFFLVAFFLAAFLGAAFRFAAFFLPAFFFDAFFLVAMCPSFGLVPHNWRKSPRWIITRCEPREA